MCTTSGMDICTMTVWVFVSFENSVLNYLPQRSMFIKLIHWWTYGKWLRKYRHSMKVNLHACMHIRVPCWSKIFQMNLQSERHYNQLHEGIRWWGWIHPIPRWVPSPLVWVPQLPNEALARPKILRWYDMYRTTLDVHTFVRSSCPSLLCVYFLSP
jgi:hypothetical protein